MSLPSFVVGDQDADLPVWVEWHSLKWRGLQRASLILLETRRLLHDALALVFGDPPRFGPPASMRTCGAGPKRVLTPTRLSMR